MYLSRLRLDPGPGATPLSDRLLRDPYLLHQAVFAAFDPRAREKRRVLYRREPELHEGLVTLLVQSPIRPDWSRGLAKVFTEAAEPEVRELSLDFRRGQWMHFRLRANPTYRTRDNKRRSILSGLSAEAKEHNPAYYNAVLSRLSDLGETNPSPARMREFVLEQWLRRQLAGAAAELDFQVTDEDLYSGEKPYNGGLATAHRLQFKSVRYDGVLAVSDPDLLRQRVIAGIGSGKAFGFGLLSLAPR